jgi:hypothetical protein
MYYLENHKTQKDPNSPEWQVFDATVKKLIDISSEHIDIVSPLRHAANAVACAVACNSHTGFF